MSTNRRALNPTDRRVVRTRQLLKQSLHTLMLEKGYDAVTIQDITDHANLGRATFYIHYNDKEELLMQSLTEIFDDLVKQGGDTVQFDAPPGQGNHALITFRHADQNRTLYRVMLSSTGAPNLTRRIREYLIDVSTRLITSTIAVDKLPIPVEILAQHSVGSLLALLTWWLETDAPYSPEYMAETFRRLHFGPINPQVLAGIVLPQPADHSNPAHLVDQP